ncbi:MAG: 5-amino-6-(D-ribitylamino)uracil--L-tyrosine 4-hydroxyphenyl transferase CofH [Candidatus Hodarchaeales archaeon]
MSKNRRLFDRDFEELLFRGIEGRELSEQQVIALLNAEGSEFHALMSAADQLRFKQVGDGVSFVINRNINFTNICVKNCRFCYFSVFPGDKNGYYLSREEIQAKVSEGLEKNITEVCMQGGIAPGVNYDTYIDILRAVREVDGTENIHIHAFSPQEVLNAAHTSDMSVKSVLQSFKEEGLDSMPGTAAELLVDKIRTEICPGKLSTDEWVNVIRTAHGLGIKTTATILHGHVERAEDISKHLLLLKSMQERTGGFTEFIPLSFISEYRKENKLYRPSVDTMKDLKIYAVSRLVLGSSFSNIQSSWVKLGKRMCQLALNCGCNDIGGTLMEESISKKASGGKTAESMTAKDLVELILAAGRKPVQRTTDYRVLCEYGDGVIQ